MSFENRVRSIHFSPLFYFAISVPTLILYFGKVCVRRTKCEFEEQSFVGGFKAESGEMCAGGS